ncbi:hypothetical protein ILYODFUR_037195 [Ilyodon furcidens]|uniref:Uncharacterized protein n=1 Tax=Ilyodon furcidens TaxID=33524 RepID=A0ABV0V990_9TELE
MCICSNFLLLKCDWSGPGVPKSHPRATVLQLLDAALLQHTWKNMLNADEATEPCVSGVLEEGCISRLHDGSSQGLDDLLWFSRSIIVMSKWSQRTQRYTLVFEYLYEC